MQSELAEAALANLEREAKRAANDGYAARAYHLAVEFSNTAPSLNREITVYHI